MDELGLSQTQLGQLAFGKPNASAFQNLKSGSSPAVDRLEAMANALGLELYFGPRRAPDGLADPSGEGDLDRPEALRARYLPIPWVQMGRRPHRPPLAVAAEWFENRRIPPQNVRAFEPDHDMTGFALGDVTTLIDVEALQIDEASPALFAWSRAGRTYVGLLQLVGQNATCINAERRLGVTDLGAARGLHILGKVVLFGISPQAGTKEE